jgi:hypothetical protein
VPESIGIVDVESHSKHLLQLAVQEYSTPFYTCASQHVNILCFVYQMVSIIFNQINRSKVHNDL